MLGRVSLIKRVQKTVSEMYALGGDYERACDTAQVDLMLPEHGEGRHLASCCASTSASGQSTLVVFVHCMEASARIFRLEALLPAEDEPFELGELLKPTHTDTELQGDFARPCVLHAIDPHTCIVGTDEGKLATAQFNAQGLAVAPMLAGGGGLYEAASSAVFGMFGASAPAASAVVCAASCMHGAGHLVCVVHSDGKVGGWMVPTTSEQQPCKAQSIFQEQVPDLSVIKSGALLCRGPSVCLTVQGGSRCTSCRSSQPSGRLESMVVSNGLLDRINNCTANCVPDPAGRRSGLEGRREC